MVMYIFMAYKQGWIYVQKWMWLQWSMEYFQEFSLDDVVLSVYHWGYLQMGSCGASHSYSSGVDSTWDHIEDLQDTYRPIKVLFLRIWFTMMIIYGDVYDYLPERCKSV